MKGHEGRNREKPPRHPVFARYPILASLVALARRGNPDTYADKDEVLRALLGALKNPEKDTTLFPLLPLMF